MTTNKATKKVKAKFLVIPASPVALAENVPDALFPIVGMGASAGGLEAFEQFFRSVPPDSGMAFVLVSHLDPSHVSILTEILQRTTAMPVVQVQDQMAVAPNGVYVIPPNRDMANILPSNQSFEGYEVEHDFPAIGHHRILLNARRIVDNTGDTKMILLGDGKDSIKTSNGVEQVRIHLAEELPPCAYPHEMGVN